MATTTAPVIRQTEHAAGPKHAGHAGFLDYAGVAIDSLRANKLRSFLTLLGIIIGITSIISVISIIQGLDKYWKQKVSNFGPNTFVITQFPITTNLDKLFEMIRRNPDIHSDAGDSIRRSCGDCEAVGVEVHKQVNVRYGRQSLEQIDMSGITPNIVDIEGFGVDLGRPLQEWDEERSRFVAFIGADVAEKLFLGIDPIGKTMQIDDHSYTVVGVAEKKGTVFGFSRDNFAKIPISTFQKIYGSRRTVNISIRGREGQM
ncbi:MAG: ABC transporter permease, partial [Blastocatellia bacterium]